MPSLPTPIRRPWQPAPVSVPYQQHTARSAEYGTARWQKARKTHLDANPCCTACTAKGRTTMATVVDHIQPVRLGGGMWDASNYAALCRPCHQAKSGRERRIPTPANSV